MELRQLSDGFGAESGTIPQDFREVWDAFFASQVLVLRKQKFTPATFLAFARQFGNPEPHVIDQFHHPEHADILILSNVQKDGQPTGLADAAPISTPITRISTCRRARPRCIRSRCRRSAATPCSPTSTRPTTASPKA
jgi:hypothetical protein